MSTATKIADAIDSATTTVRLDDDHSRTVLRGVADALTVLADSHYQNGDGDCAAADALDDLARYALALIGEQPGIRDGEPHDPTDPRI